MIQGTYYKEWSSVLNREMEFQIICVLFQLAHP